MVGLNAVYTGLCFMHITLPLMEELKRPFNSNSKMKFARIISGDNPYVKGGKLHTSSLCLIDCQMLSAGFEGVSGMLASPVFRDYF